MSKLHIINHYYIMYQRQKMAAVVPQKLIQSYENMDLIGRVFSVGYFKVKGINFEYPRFENYSFVRRDWEITVNSQTTFTRMTEFLENIFTRYPMVTSIQTLQEDRTQRKMLIGTLIYLLGLYKTIV